jgi:hypothetical protein
MTLQGFEGSRVRGFESKMLKNYKEMKFDEFEKGNFPSLVEDPAPAGREGIKGRGI